MKRIFLLLSILALVSCGQNRETQISQLENDILTLQKEVNFLSFKLNLLQKKTSDDIRAYTPFFTSNSLGYTLVNSNVGYFVVSLDEIKPYGNGYKVIFNVTNPSSLTFQGMRATVLWGNPPTQSQNYDDWRKSLKSTEEEVHQLFLPGYWNKVSFTVAPANINELSVLLISLQVDKINLTKDLRN